MAQALQKQQTWPDIVKEVMPDFNRIASTHKLVQWQAESQFAIQALQKNKSLSECAPYTVQNAVINVAAVGLTLNPADGYAYLVPEYNKQTQQKECELRISFKGLMKVATDSGAIQWVQADVVKENDTFVYNGIGQMPDITIHTPFDHEARGDTVGVYCIAKLYTGEYMVETMSIAEITQIMDCAKTKVVWEQWFDEMAKKAVIKRASKQWPKTEQHSTLNAAVHVLNETEGSDPNYLIFTPEQQEAFDKAVESEDPLAYLAVTDGMDGDVYTALFDANKERERENKGMTKRSELMNRLNSDGLDMFRVTRETILELLEDGDHHAVKEVFDEYKEYGLGNKLWNSFDEDQQAEILEAVNNAESEQNSAEEPGVKNG